MIASHKGDCVGCGERIDIGDTIYWVHDRGARCEECGPHDSEPSGAATGMEDAPGYVRKLHERIDGLELNIAAQYGDLVALQAWAEKLSEELGVEKPDMPE